MSAVGEGRSHVLLHLFAGNKTGTAAGIGYSAASFLAFFAILGHGAGCPEAGPQYCDSPIFGVLRGAYFVIYPHVASWSAFYFSFGQVAQAAGMPVDGSQQQLFFLIPASMFVATFALWAFVGAGSQRAIKRLF